MPADLTREDVERLDDEYQHTGWVSLADAVRLLQHALAEPARIEAARQEGYREGAEACAVWLETQAAAFLDARNQHMRASEAARGSLAEVLHSRRACSAEATAASLSEAAAGLRRLSPAPAEPEEPCPVCGNEERGQGGYLSCECPAPAEPSAPVAEYRARIAALFQGGPDAG